MEHLMLKPTINPTINPMPSNAAAKKVANQAQAGQFSYIANPDVLWPDFLMGQAASPLRVILVDADTRMCNVVSQELNLDARINLVGTANNVRDGKQLIGRQMFDVMLVDTHLGDGLGLELIKHMKVLRPSAEAVVISVRDDAQNALDAFQQGASGYLVKNSWFGNFTQAVLQVANGGAFISPNLARRLLQKLTEVHNTELNRFQTRMPVDHNNKKLSQREIEILSLVAAGYSSAEVAVKITISEQTVTTHMKNIYRKLNVHTRMQAVTSAKNQGLLN